MEFGSARCANGLELSLGNFEILDIRDIDHMPEELAGKTLSAFTLDCVGVDLKLDCDGSNTTLYTSSDLPLAMVVAAEWRDHWEKHKRGIFFDLRLYMTSAMLLIAIYTAAGAKNFADWVVVFLVALGAGFPFLVTFAQVAANWC